MAITNARIASFRTQTRRNRHREAATNSLPTRTVGRRRIQMTFTPRVPTVCPQNDGDYIAAVGREAAGSGTEVRHQTGTVPFHHVQKHRQRHIEIGGETDKVRGAAPAPPPAQQDHSRRPRDIPPLTPAALSLIPDRNRHGSPTRTCS